MASISEDERATSPRSSAPPPGVGYVGQGDHSYRVDADWMAVPTEWAAPDVSGAAVDREDNVYLLSPDESVLRVYSGAGQLIERVDIGASEAHAAEPRATYPHSVALADGGFLVTDIKSNTVRAMAATGHVVRTFGTSAPPASGPTDDFRSVTRAAPSFNGPTKVAVARTGDLYISDGYRNASIHCFSADGSHKFSWGSPGRAAGEFRLPHSVAITPRDEVVVADRENNRLAFFDLRGRYLREWTGVNRPTDIAIDNEGTLYVTELGLYATLWDFLPADHPGAAPSRCTVFDPEGGVLARWGSRDPDEPGSLFAPHCVAVDSRGDVYIGEVNLVRAWPKGRPGMAPWRFRTLQKFVRI